MLSKCGKCKGLVGLREKKIFPLSSLALRKGGLLPGRPLPEHSIVITCAFNYVDFPPPHWDPNIKAICHPFRNEECFPKGVPKFTLADSDFEDDVFYDFAVAKAKKRFRYDFCCFTKATLKGVVSKGWALIPLLDQAARRAGLRGVVVNYGPHEKGTGQVPDPDLYMKLLDQVERKIRHVSNLDFVDCFLRTEKMFGVVASSRFSVILGERDSSPRVITESLLADRLVLVNKNIYGGWHYVNSQTGVLADLPCTIECANSLDETIHKYTESFASALVKLRDRSKHMYPREAFTQCHGFRNSARKLAKILQFAGAGSYEQVVYSDWERYLKV